MQTLRYPADVLAYALYRSGGYYIIDQMYHPNNTKIHGSRRMWILRTLTQRFPPRAPLFIIRFIRKNPCRTGPLRGKLGPAQSAANGPIHLNQRLILFLKKRRQTLINEMSFPMAIDDPLDLFMHESILKTIR